MELLALAAIVMSVINFIYTRWAVNDLAKLVNEKFERMNDGKDANA